MDDQSEPPEAITKFIEKLSKEVNDIGASGQSIEEMLTQMAQDDQSTASALSKLAQFLPISTPNITSDELLEKFKVLSVEDIKRIHKMVFFEEEVTDQTLYNPEFLLNYLIQEKTYSLQDINTILRTSKVSTIEAAINYIKN